MSTKGTVIAAAVAGLFAAATPFAVSAKEAAKDTKEASVHCTGVNACKGKGGCHGADNACKGQNGCKGKGWMSMSEKDCKAKGGSVAAEKAPDKK